MNKNWMWTLCVFAASAWAQSLAQGQPSGAPVERAVVKAGDRWVYRTVDRWSGHETGRLEVVLISEGEGHLVFRQQPLSPGSDAVTVRTNADQMPCRAMRGGSEMVCGGALRFPLLASGAAWSYKKYPFRDGRGFFDADCTSKGFEKVRVPAGEFDAVRVECRGFWTLVFEGSANGRFEESLWFAPVAKRFVQQELRTYRSNGQLNVNEQTELVEYRLNP